MLKKDSILSRQANMNMNINTIIIYRKISRDTLICRQSTLTGDSPKNTDSLLDPADPFPPNSESSAFVVCDKSLSSPWVCAKTQNNSSSLATASPYTSFS